MYHQLTTPSFALISQTSASSQIHVLCGKRSRLQLVFCNEEGNALNTHHCQIEGVTETKQFVCEGYRCILCYKPGNEQNIYLVEYLFQTSTVSTLLNNFSMSLSIDHNFNICNTNYPVLVKFLKSSLASIQYEICVLFILNFLIN